MKIISQLLLFMTFLPLWSWGQEGSTVKGNVFNIQNKLPLENVNVLNISQIKGTVTNLKGDFSIRAAVNDTLYFSSLGYKSIKIAVTSDMIKYPGTKIGLTELAYALEEVVITPYKLTGYLEIDAKYLPINTNKQYNIAGLNKGYEVRERNSDPSIAAKVIGAIYNPAGALYNIFSKHAKDMRKIKKMKSEDSVRNILAEKFDRETLCQMLNIERKDLEDLLGNCNFSADFIKQANDLQILDAISQCYDQYRLLKN